MNEEIRLPYVEGREFTDPDAQQCEAERGIGDNGYGGQAVLQCEMPRGHKGAHVVSSMLGLMAWQTPAELGWTLKAEGFGYDVPPEPSTRLVSVPDGEMCQHCHAPCEIIHEPKPLHVSATPYHVCERHTRYPLVSVNVESLAGEIVLANEGAPVPRSERIYRTAAILKRHIPTGEV